MRLICLLAISVFAAPMASAESIRAETCRKADDVRTIEVISPGVVGLACDVVYSRDGGSNVAVPYNANVDKDFCRARAAELAATLAADGFDCATSASQSIEASLAGGEPVADRADAPLDAQLKQFEAAEDRATEAPPAEVDSFSIAADTPPDEALEQPQVPAHTQTPDYAAAPSAAPSAGPQTPAPAEPIQLAADARVSEFRAPKPPKAKGPGRLVGAQPSIEDIVDVSTAPKTAAKPMAAPSENPQAVRATDEIIRSVLAANAAAWNEGNLDAFMGGYADSADLLMVKDAVVTTGWREVKKAFEQEIAAKGGMGRLTFADIDVSLTSPDVATIAGRYAVERQDAVAAGVMTLVMKQINGHWRIVQDTRTANGAVKP